MRKNKSNSKFQKYMIACIAVMLVLISSCNIKTGIKSMLGLPATEKQSVNSKKTIFSYGSVDNCFNIATSETNIAKTVLGQSANSLPTSLLYTIFVFLFGFFLIAEKPHPHYGSIKNSGSLPLFLQYRKLII